MQKDQSAFSTPTPKERADSEQIELSRRGFLGTVGGATVALTAGATVFPALTGQNTAQAGGPGWPLEGQARKQAAYQKRLDAALVNLLTPVANHATNGDEALYGDKIASFSKGLPHNSFGEPDVVAYRTLTRGLRSENQSVIDVVPSGEPNPAQRMRLVNPLAGAAYDLEGADSHDFVQPPAPAFASAEEAGELVENYWMARLRDVAFTDYATSPLAQQALADLTALSDFRGPKQGGQVTAQTLFRDDLPGALLGPYVSQFFWKSQPFGAQYVEPRVRSTAAGVDYGTTQSTWLDLQNGRVPTASLSFDPTLRYLRNGRDLGQWVHIDVLYQAYFQAGLALLTPPDPGNPFTGGGIGCPVNPGNPYLGSAMQDGFGTFGGPYFMTILTEVATRALKSVWFQKWFVHRRLRPEEFAGRVHHKIVSGRPYPIHPDVLNSAGLAQVFSQYGTYFLPLAFTEGCPLHPAYGAGHGTVAGACVTILKALFDESYVIQNPVVAANDGLSLQAYTGPDAGQLTVGGELNKLAINVAFGRNIAGVHWRTDGHESLLLGEQLAISVLRDQRETCPENFQGFTFTRFDGTTITV